MDKYRRAKILDAVDRLGEATADDVHKLFGGELSKSLVWTLMRNYWHRSLLRRRKGMGKYVYALTDRGRQRLKYYRRIGVV